MQVIKADGSLQPFDVSKIQGHAKWACEGLDVSQSELESSLTLQFFDGMKTQDIADAMIMTASSLISEEHPDFDFVAARLTIQSIYKEVTGGGIEYPSLKSMIDQGLAYGQLDPRMGDGRFNLDVLDKVIEPANDFLFKYIGIQTLRDRYLLTKPRIVGERQKVYEMPQHFLMRVAMGLALEEDNPTARAAEFYQVMSCHEYIPSTPTLFNSGTTRPQMSSCYVGYVPDDLGQIFDLGFKQNALLSKFAGGIGASWTPVRAAGSVIKSTNGESGGVVPFLKIFDSVAVAVDQGGKRKGSFAPYLEVWHADIFEFCDLRLKTGDDYIRTHSIHPASWIPDLFMKRKNAGQDWSLFCPADVPHLHDLHGEAFEKAYLEAEQAGLARKTVPAMDLWKYLLDKLVRTGYPWITFKDSCNRRNPQQHVGTIHNSNLCTEITLVNDANETAVCNLGSINLSKVKRGRELQRVTRTAVRMLDNVIDLNLYPYPNTERSNKRHRPVGLGVMGYQEAMVRDDIEWESEAHLQWADELFEEISYYAIDSSADLAAQRGAYPSFQGSTWSKGLLTIDHAQEKTYSVFSKTEWDVLREKVRKGIRNSNILSIAPTATIANILGTTECIQPINERVYTKENLSGNFTVINPLRKYGKPRLEKTVWEIDQEWSIRAAAKRQKWICQSQSLNLYRRQEHTGRVLDRWYTLAWELGVKTTYYLRNHRPVAERVGDNTPAVEADPGDYICEACQ